MPDTVDSLEPFSLVVIVHRHAAAEDCSQSRTAARFDAEKVRVISLIAKSASTGTDQRREVPNRGPISPWADFAEIGSVRLR